MIKSSIVIIFVFLCWVFYFNNSFYYSVFVSLYFLLFFLYFPKKLFSPDSFVYSFYFVFYVLSPAFATRYEEVDNDYLYQLVFAYLYTSLSVIIFALNFSYRGLDNKINKSLLVVENKLYKSYYLYFFYLMQFFFSFMIISNSGGFYYWLESPGDAFLNRSGTGFYVVFSHFFSFIISVYSGVLSYNRGKKIFFYFFIFWLILTSPVHGSKGLLFSFLLLFFLPYILNARFFSLYSFYFFMSFVFIFSIGLYFRNLSWITVEDFLPYALNYFTSLENLYISVRDFDPGFMTTFWLPFNKFLILFYGIDPLTYHDMNHMLTDIYFPKAWEIRATEQWPVETDLYLNFYFFGGLPLLALYFYALGKIYSAALLNSNVGLYVVSALLILSIPTHLRGSLYNHVDFYFYPMLFVFYFLFRRFRYVRLVK